MLSSGCRTCNQGPNFENAPRREQTESMYLSAIFAPLQLLCFYDKAVSLHPLDTYAYQGDCKWIVPEPPPTISRPTFNTLRADCRTSKFHQRLLIRRQKLRVIMEHAETGDTS